MGEQQTIGVGVIGLGFMGQTHLAAYQAACEDGVPCRVVAVTDRNPERLSGFADASGNLAPGEKREQLFDPEVTATTTDLQELLASDAVDLVSVCTHTDSHVEVAVQALHAGKHVLLEKPVALSVEGVRTIMEAAKAAGRWCMPAMCMRFWPEWAWLKEAVATKAYGAVVSARFERLGAAPAWGDGFYNDPNRSGGALFDLHVHDVDFVYHLFGQPQGLHSVGTRSHVSTSFEYTGIAGQVVAEGGWLTASTFPFRMRYIVEFERAVADFDITRDPTLQLHDNECSKTIEVSGKSGYDGQIRHMVDLALGQRVTPVAPLQDAEAVTGLILAERASLETGSPVVLPPV